MGLKIVERYFPTSFSKWKVENPNPAKVFSDEPSLRCKVCDKELLAEGKSGIITFWQDMKKGDYSKPDNIRQVFWTCRGHCDRVLKDHMRGTDLIDKWEDIADVTLPPVYAQWIMSTFNELRCGVVYSDEAFGAPKEFMLNIYPFVVRHPSEKDKERISDLTEVPAFLGGLGYEK